MRALSAGLVAVLLAGVCAPAVQAQAVAAATARAEVAEATLTLTEVLRSSARHAPQILEAMARERQADGRTLGAQGLFDLVFEADAQARPLGYYDGALADLRASRPLTGNGGNVYAGYRLSSGAFAGYDGKSVTNQLGEMRVGVLFSLLRDSLTDERRTRLALAESDRTLAGLEREMIAIGVQRRALDAWQQWVMAGQRVAIFRNLLGLASERQRSIERQVELGARPAVLAVENRQNILRRESLLVRAEQDLAVTARSLSLFLRDDLGRPVVPVAARLPASLDLPEAPVTDDAAALAGRPDLKALVVRLEQAGARAALAENDLRPRLDLRVEASKDVGAGSYVRTPAEAMVGLRFALPLQQRQAQGRMAEAQAETEALTLRYKLLGEQVAVEIGNLRTQVAGAGRLAGLATDEAALAERMATAERRRFALGASDFLLVNLREEAAADARLRELDAHYRQSAARADLQAALADTRRLGLTAATADAS